MHPGKLFHLEFTPGKKKFNNNVIFFIVVPPRHFFLDTHFLESA